MTSDGMEVGACSCDWDDYERPSVFTRKIKKARKEHRCCECREPISVGAHYEFISGLWDSEWSTFKTCLTCAQIRVDFCAPFGMLRETLRETLGCELTR